VLDLEVFEVDELSVVAAGEALGALGLGKAVVGVRLCGRNWGSGGHSG